MYLYHKSASKRDCRTLTFTTDNHQIIFSSGSYKNLRNCENVNHSFLKLEVTSSNCLFCQTNRPFLFGGFAAAGVKLLSLLAFFSHSVKIIKLFGVLPHLSTRNSLIDGAWMLNNNNDAEFHSDFSCTEGAQIIWNT